MIRSSSFPNISGAAVHGKVAMGHVQYDTYAIYVPLVPVLEAQYQFLSLMMSSSDSSQDISSIPLPARTNTSTT